MPKLSEDHTGKKTQTDTSAFFCLRKDLARILVIGILLAPATGAQTVVNRKPDVRLRGVSIQRVDWSRRTAETELSIVVDNPGPAFKLKDLSYRLKLNDTLAGEGKYEQEITVAAASDTTIDLPCSVDLSVVPGIAWGIVAGGFDVRYQLATEFTLPILPPFEPRIKTTIGGDLSLASTVSGWTAKIKERLSKE